jgi:AcrR family transcriptional regulator
MTKGLETRDAILLRATELASQVGLGGLSIGALAEDLELSKSGLFAHFGSKENLQIQVLEHAAMDFTEAVVRPALKESRGEPRMRALFERWLAWDKDGLLPGGCVFVAAATELDDRPGPVRDRLVELQRLWLDLLAGSFQEGILAGRFRSDADPDQFAQDLHGVMLAFHHAMRLMADPEAESRARRAFDALIAAALRPGVQHPT